MFSRDRLVRGLKSPNLFLREANRLYYRRLYTREYNTAGVDVFAEDWDNLLILDACRYDMFEEQADLPGTLASRTSRGSSTEEFLTGNVRGRELHDVVYVTANPQFFRHRDWLEASFHAVEHVWRTEGWDEEYRTVLPETTTEHALEAAERYPNKRLLVHYIQPHYPIHRRRPALRRRTGIPRTGRSRKLATTDDWRTGSVAGNHLASVPSQPRPHAF